MSPRVLAVLWFALGAAVWSGIFDIYVSRGAREYAQLRLEHQYEGGPSPDMMAVMSRAKRDGVTGASLWAGIVVVSGLGTIWILRRGIRRS